MKNINKRVFRGLILSLVVVVFFVSAAMGSGFREVVEVVFNSINLTVNGEKVEADTILHEGTTYVPIRDVGEMLGKEVGWDGKTNTASIDDEKIVSDSQTSTSKSGNSERNRATELYKSETGTKYHRASCPTLRGSKFLISSEEARREYEPCKICKP